MPSARITHTPRAADPSHVTTLYLARHGQSEWNNRSRISGQADVGLSPEGRRQSEAIARCLAHEPLDAVYTSALRRTIDTAAPTAAAKGLPVLAMAALNEIHRGMLEGRLRDERDPEAQALWAAWRADPWRTRVPGGESFGDLAERVETALQAILDSHPGQRILVVGHRGTNRVVLGTLLHWPRERWLDAGMRNKFFYRLRLTTPPTVHTYTLSGGKAGTLRDGLVM